MQLRRFCRMRQWWERIRRVGSQNVAVDEHKCLRIITLGLTLGLLGDCLVDVQRNGRRAGDNMARRGHGRIAVGRTMGRKNYRKGR